MNDSLAGRIKRAYPSGQVYGLVEGTLDSDERDDRIVNVVRTVSEACALAVTLDLFKKPAYKLTFTQKDNPPFEEWIYGMGNSQKLAWIASNNGEPYPAFWLKISRVADYYDYFYNHWVPRGDTGYLDADCRRLPNARWSEYEKRIRQELESNRFEYLTSDLACEKTPFALEQEHDSIPEDDPRWKEDGFEPPWVPSTVYRCLFKV